MPVHKRDNALVPTVPFDQRRHVVHDAELVRLLIALGPALKFVHSRLRAARVPRLHEARAHVEDTEGRAERAAERRGEYGDGVVVIWLKISSAEGSKDNTAYIRSLASTQRSRCARRS